MIDILRIGSDCGLQIRDYRYVGMGANRFYDFLLLHKYLGLRDMVSLEHDPDMYARATFNVPYRFIDVRHMSVVDFLAADRSEKSEVFWLDYDGGIGPEIVADIMSMSTRLKLGDFCFITAGGLPPRALENKSDEERLVALSDAMGDVAGGLTVDDVERSSFPRAVHKILIAAFKNAFAPRRDGTFVPLLQVGYSDSMPMVTVGGAFLPSETAVEYRRRMMRALALACESGERGAHCGAAGPLPTLRATLSRRRERG